ncbi:AlpA family phage regulatory protein [Schauerella aestuarii]|uniref:AlpA family phage regulatory protein n=1 Tax=Schauerella aestuarii TaxID=2511204 RepID=UPI0038B30A9D|nr:AlpA family phage regulatory protein [Achromobacter aestuarii]
MIGDLRTHDLRQMAESSAAIGWSDVTALTGLSRHCIQDLMRGNRFPSPIDNDALAQGWLEGDVHRWMRGEWPDRDA